MKTLQVILFFTVFFSNSVDLFSQKTIKQKMIGSWEGTLVMDIDEGIKGEVNMYTTYSSNGFEVSYTKLKYIVNGQKSDVVMNLRTEIKWSIRETYSKVTLEEELIKCEAIKNLIKDQMPYPCRDFIVLGEGDNSETVILDVTDNKLVVKIIEGDGTEEIMIFTKK